MSKQLLFLVNSDFGISNTIGIRVKPIVDNVKERNFSYLVLCRGLKKNLEEKYNCKIIFPFARYIMKILTAIPIYIFPNFPANEIKNFLFEIALYHILKKYINNNFKNSFIVHSWEFLPKIYRFLKGTNRKITIIQDIAIAFPTVLTKREQLEILGKSIDDIPKYIKNSLNYIDYFISPSEFVKESLLKLGINEDKIFVVPFGVDINKFKPIEKKHNETFKVAFSGNVNKRKGIPFLIRAWKELNLKNAELHIYGRIYPEVKNYLKDAKKYNIFLHGFTKNIEKVLPYHDIYVFPSLLEGSAKSIYEALACGLPVITTKNSGSIVEDGKEGFIIPTCNVEAIKEKILYFYKNRKKIKELGLNARKKAEKYTWENYGKNIADIYEKIGISIKI